MSAEDPLAWMTRPVEGERVWYYPDGKILYRAHVKDSCWVRRGPTLVRRSRKHHICILGCQISAGSSYAKLELQAGNGMLESFVTLALCSKHLDDFAGGDVKNLKSKESGELLDRIRALEDV